MEELRRIKSALLMPTASSSTSFMSSSCVYQNNGVYIYIIAPATFPSRYMHHSIVLVSSLRPVATSVRAHTHQGHSPCPSVDNVAHILFFFVVGVAVVYVSVHQRIILYCLLLLKIQLSFVFFCWVVVYLIGHHVLPLSSHCQQLRYVAMYCILYDLYYDVTVSY